MSQHISGCLSHYPFLERFLAGLIVRACASCKSALGGEQGAKRALARQCLSLGQTEISEARAQVGGLGGDTNPPVEVTKIEVA